MIPKLYQKDGTTLIGNLTNCIECLVEEERNGVFELTLQYPNTEAIASSLLYDNIIVCNTGDILVDQKFRIYDTRRMMSDIIEVYARHISFDLAYDYIDSIDISNQSCEYALNTIFRNSQFSTGFVGHSDIINAQNFKISNCNCLEAIAGKEGSIIDTYGTGAEVLRNNYDIYVYNKRGNDNGISIEYAKNLTGFELQENTDDLITRIIPFATYTPEGGEETRVQAGAVDSSYINNYSHPFIAEIDFSDKFEDKEEPTAAKLTIMAQRYYEENKCDLPKQNWKIEFIPLSKCAGFETLEDDISLCDTVTIKDTRYNINTKAKVIKTVYDVLRERYDSMELGEPRTTLGDIVNTGSEKGEQGPPGPQGPKGEDGNIGNFPDSVPAKPVLTTTLLGFASIQLDWTYENKPYYWYEVYANKAKDFTPNVFDIVHKGQTSSFLFQAKPGETWYFRVCAVNSFDHRSPFSDQKQVVTTKVDDLSNYFTNAAIGNAVVGSLTADYMTAGILKGNWIDAKNLSVTDGNGKRTLDIDSNGNVNLDVTSIRIASKDVATIENISDNLTNSSIQYYLSTSQTSLTGGSWQDTAPTWTQGKYMWQRMKYTTYKGVISYGTAVCIAGAKGDTGDTGEQGPQGPKGDKGDTGSSGVSITGVVNYYLATASSTGVTTSTSGWTTTVQSVTSTKKYLWNYEKISYSSGNSTTTAPCIIGTYGDKGDTGSTGATGKGIASITEHYQVSTSNSTAPISWQTTVPTLTATNKYLWNYETIKYTDNSTKDTSKRVIGVYGDKGATGPQGVQGPAGTDGVTYYTWIKYADSSTGSGISNNPTGKTYIGFAYNKTTPTESNTASDYTWSLIKGTDGIPGTDGKDGKTYYTWIKYSDNADGSGLYDTPKDTTKYIGIATNRSTATESTNKSDYVWSLFKGEDGVDGTNGTDGQGLVSSTPQWYLSTSKTTQTGGSWQDTMPQVATGKYIWTRFKNVWENPTATTYTTPVLEQVSESVKDVSNRVRTVEQTITKDGLVSIVGDYYATPGQVEEEYATKSEVTQTAENITYKFENISQANLLPHSGISSKDTSGWYILGEGGFYLGETRYVAVTAYKSSEVHAWSNDFYLGASGWYSISGWVRPETNVSWCNVYIAGTRDSSVWNWDFSHLAYSTNNCDGEWHKFEATFEVPGGLDTLAIRVANGGLKNTSSMENIGVFFGEFMLVRGKNNYPPYTDSTETLYSGITTIDRKGITVKHEGGAKTNLNSKSLDFYNNSGSRYASVINGTYAFWTDNIYHGNVGHGWWSDNHDAHLITLKAQYNNQVILSAQTLDEANGSAPMSQATGWVIVAGNNVKPSSINYWQGTTIYKAHFPSISYYYHTDDMGGTWSEIFPTKDGSDELVIKGYSSSTLAVTKDSKTYYRGVQVQYDSSYNAYKTIHMYGNLNMEGWSITNSKNVNTLGATSAASYALRTSTEEESYSDPTSKTITDIYGVQSLTNGDIRWSDKQTYFTSEWEEGVYEAYVEIPWWIAQNLELDYHVNITPVNGFFQYYVSERDPYYFIVRSDKEGMGFTFELVATLLEQNTLDNNTIIASNQYVTQEIPQEAEPPIIPIYDEPVYPTINPKKGE